MLTIMPVLAMSLLNLQPWRAVNDDVMGGVSRGEMVSAGDGLRFRGVLSLENNGGFASVRRALDSDPGPARGIRLRVCGDGRRYQFGVRMDNRFDGINWRAAFATDRTCQTIDLPFDEFKPMFRGRLVADAGPLVPARIRQLSFLLADKTPGPFQLDITGIEFLPES